MGEDSKIQWTDNTFNPWIGCTKVSQGCKNCYAETLMTRKPKWANTWGVGGVRERTSHTYWRKPATWNASAEAKGKRFKVFCGSLCDVFESTASQYDQFNGWREQLWYVIETTPYLDWLLLTKRPQNVLSMVPSSWRTRKWPSNVWIGTSVEDQETYDKRVPKLMKIPAPVRFLSCEPLLGPIRLRTNLWLYPSMLLDELNGIDWVIVGGESGPNARAMDIQWVYDIKNECHASLIPFFMKQLGGHPDKRSSMNDFPVGLELREFPLEENDLVEFEHFIDNQ